ncbi:P-loop containing nucleoside triphosphate hydrolase protein [Lojkania enalia]|uniref:ATP-dependent RNA helicase ROK1 n=1 Tax=Lojkania enalia TaxID=147567 RepID=A0A9P4N6G4_9PLEO|nr:P-loop containing nucleoside triphosphate hydrolase protein [Didymosphaeria enalia]
MSLAASRAVLRHSTFAVRRAGVRNASSTSDVANTAKEKTADAQSKAAQGLSRVTSSAGSALSRVGGALGKVGGRTGRLIGGIQSLIPPTIYYSKVAFELGKLVAQQRKFSPPDLATFQTYFLSYLSALRHPGQLLSRTASAGAQPVNILNRVRNLTTAQWVGAGVVAAEVIGFFSVASLPSPAQKVPSSGAVANPQLFGHEETPKQTNDQKKGRKRKRGQDEAEPSSVLPPELDFFSGARHEVAGERRNGIELDRQPKCEAIGKRIKHDERELEDNADTADVYGEDEAKRILRSHKLKIVVLEDFAAREETKKEKKKSKKRKREKEESGEEKKHKQQLFPRPLMSFKQLRSRYGISRRVADNIEAQGYRMPTEVQIGALPLLLGDGNGLAGKMAREGVDLLTIAPTGSGKTIAFLIPIINSLLSDRSTASERSKQGVRAVIIAPTKELASQIMNETRKLAKGTGIYAALMKKGMEIVDRPDDKPLEEDAEQEDASTADEECDNSDNDGVLAIPPKSKRRRAEKVKAGILVATPLALLNAIKSCNGNVSLPTVRHLVLDEADILLDPLFREQTLAVWNACTNPLLRVGLWSATMSSSIESLAINTISERCSSLSSSSLPSRAPFIRLVVGLKDTAIPNINHKLIYAATEQGKLLGLRQLLHPTASSTDKTSLRPPFLIFTQTIPRAIALHSELLYDIPPEAGGSSRIAVLHADLSSSARDSIMTRFRLGEIWVLITTDLLARGVDFRGLNGVVNYDVPNSAAAYIHRVGRTGRAGREGGIAVTYYTQEDVPYVKGIANVIRAAEKLRGRSEEEQSVKQWLIDALPTPTKRDKKLLKRRGVEARREVKDSKGKGNMRISTKSGYERKLENRRKGAKIGTKWRGGEERLAMRGAGGESEFEGFEN